mmetsp:Transcript_35618/g.142230  ORF Transcript_35618/g.142230 Transcript_35618/m.142230 type:complete len:132 (+) Transcript_35618:3283-3678(+)
MNSTHITNDCSQAGIDCFADQRMSHLTFFRVSGFSQNLQAPLRKLKVRALDRHQRWRVDDSGFMDKWTGQSEIREFEDTVDMFVAEERSRKGLQYCDKSSSPTFAIYKDYPELAIILTALYKARMPCLVAT